MEFFNLFLQIHLFLRLLYKLLILFHFQILNLLQIVLSHAHLLLKLRHFFRFSLDQLLGIIQFFLEIGVGLLFLIETARILVLLSLHTLGQLVDLGLHFIVDYDLRSLLFANILLELSYPFLFLLSFTQNLLLTSAKFLCKMSVIVLLLLELRFGLHHGLIDCLLLFDQFSNMLIELIFLLHKLLDFVLLLLDLRLEALFFTEFLLVLLLLVVNHFLLSIKLPLHVFHIFSARGFDFRNLELIVLFSVFSVCCNW